jgi:hypothetical protein
MKRLALRLLCLTVWPVLWMLDAIAAASGTLPWSIAREQSRKEWHNVWMR